MIPPLIALVGPTATGKSSLAVEFALLLQSHGLGAEIVNGDSMLVYRGMAIGTAKPTPAEQRGIPHHLIDILDVTQTATVAAFQGLARSAITEIRGRGAVPILVGGSALYTHAVLDSFTFQPSDAEVRARWEDELERVGSTALHARLAEVAPASAARIEPGNGRRIVRALEIHELQGEHNPSLPEEWTYELDAVTTFGLDLDRALLDERISQRVDEMWAAGLVQEVESLIPLGLKQGLTARRAIGYRQVLEYLSGQITEEEAKQAIKRATRRFARKQLGWYRRDPRINWLQADDPANPKAIFARMGDWPR